MRYGSLGFVATVSLRSPRNMAKYDFGLTSGLVGFGC